jgi:hypothetical protein
MAGILAAQTSVYEFPLEAVNELIAKDMNVSVECIKVEYVVQEVGNDYMDRGGWMACTKVKVTVDQVKLAQLRK